MYPDTNGKGIFGLELQIPQTSTPAPPGAQDKPAYTLLLLTDVLELSEDRGGYRSPPASEMCKILKEKEPKKQKTTMYILFSKCQKIEILPLNNIYCIFTYQGLLTHLLFRIAKKS